LTNNDDFLTKAFGKVDIARLLEKAGFQILDILKELIKNPAGIPLAAILIGIMLKSSHGSKIIPLPEGEYGPPEKVETLGFDFYVDLLPFDVPGLIPKEAGSALLSDTLIGAGIVGIGASKLLG
tara:strand:+ start:354 stop:725 length:372 start_codon:yes stop_codon:yes gene_type:complete